MNTNTVFEDYWSKTVTDCVKGYMCICILIHHLYQYSGFFSQTYFGHFLQMLGSWGVAVFLFISGYGLMISYIEKEGYLKTFFRKRFLPLYFSYAVFVILYFIAFPQNLSLEYAVKSFTWGGTAVYSGWFFQMILPLYLIFYLSFRFVKKVWTGFAVFFAFSVLYAFICTKCGQRHIEITLFIFGMTVACLKKRFDCFLQKNMWLVLIISFAVFFSVYWIYVRSVIMGRFVLSANVLNSLIILSDIAIVFFVLSVCLWSKKIDIPLIVNPVSKWFSKYSLEIYGMQTMIIYLLLPVFGRTVPFVLITFISTVVVAVVLKKFTSLVWKVLTKSKANA